MSLDDLIELLTKIENQYPFDEIGVTVALDRIRGIGEFDFDVVFTEDRVVQIQLK